MFSCSAGPSSPGVFYLPERLFLGRSIWDQAGLPTPDNCCHRFPASLTLARFFPRATVS